MSERVARSYLRPGDAIGQTLTLAVDGKPRLYRVAAVIADPPRDATYRNDLFARLDPADIPGGVGGHGLVTFLRFATPEAARARVAALPAFEARHPDPQFTGAPGTPKLTETVVPLASLHLHEPRDRAVVVAMGAVGVLALLVAVVNYVNLATARAGLRAREVAIRKVAGAARGALVAQFLGEAVAATALASLVALALVELSLPVVNAAGGTALTVVYVGAGSILLPLALLVVAVGVLAGVYPALILSRPRPAPVLAASRAPGGPGGRRLRAGLVVAQFAVATALLIGVAGLAAETRHLRSADLGFRREALVLVPSFADPSLDPAQRADLLAALARTPGVVAVTQSAVAVGGGSFGIATMHRAGGASPNVIQAETGPGFFGVYGARLLAGRPLDARLHPSDEAPAEGSRRATAVVLNRTATRALGFATAAEAVGASLSLGDGAATVVGVVDDIRFGTPRAPVEATAYLLRSGGLYAPVLAARVAGDPRRVIDATAGVWRRIAPAAPFRAQTADETLDAKFYRADARRARLFSLGAGLAAAIACLGLYGLTAFDTARRGREIGIRRALGASRARVLALLVGQFVRPVVVGALLAWPVAWLVLRRWLAGFDDPVALSSWLFLGALAAAVLVAVATVVAQAWRLAAAEPGRALRWE